MAHQFPQRKPTFFWQGLLILLPVALMAAFSAWAILHARNAVEQEARQRAREILAALPSDLGGMVAAQLTQLEAQRADWEQNLEKISLWQERAHRQQILVDTNQSQTASNAPLDLPSAFPGVQAVPAPLVVYLLNTNGDLLYWHAQSRPPPWLTTMSAEQSQAWATLQMAACAHESSSGLAGLSLAFQRTQPPLPALACAEFIQLRAGLPALSATNAINQLLQFCSRHRQDISESGVPLTTLALAEAMKQAKDMGPTAQLWAALNAEVRRPTALTSILLDEAGQLVSKDSQLSEAVSAMGISLADHQAQAELFEAVRQTGKLNGIKATNLWVDAIGHRWFSVLIPTEMGETKIISNRQVLTVTTIARVNCYSKSMIAQAFAAALLDAKIQLPDYFGISLAVEAESISLASPWNKLDQSNSAGETMAEEHFEMLHLSGMRQLGLPHFLLQIHLTDRDLLYAKQRQLQWIFGTLIAASALAALIGFVAARGAFHRQLQLSEMKSNFVSSVSHELRAPIASVRLMAENLERGKVSEPAGQSAYFHFIVQECQRLSSLIENILDFSRIEEGRKQYEFEPTDLVALTRQTITSMEPRAADCEVQLETALPEQTLSVEADGKALQQALVNLIDNALKHSPKGAAVKIGLDADADTVRLWVEDLGEGIPPAEHARIFERFYRRGSELRRETQGVGIGLSIVKHIVEAHGGRISVRSAVGQGSRFTIELSAKNV